MAHTVKARLLLAGTALLAMAGPAFPLDGTDLLAKINAAMGMPSAPLAAQSTDVNGSTVILRGATYKPAVTAPAVAIGDITLDGVEEDSGSYFIETVTFPDVDVTEDKTNITMADISMSNVIVPADTTGDTLESVLLYENASSGPIAVKVEGKTIFTVASTQTTTDVAEDMSAAGFTVEINGITADLSTVQDPKSSDALQTLGLTNLDGDVTISGNWQAEEGLVDIEEYAIDFDDIGKLAFAASLSGYTMDFVRSAQEVSANMENASQENREAAGLAMLGLMQRLTFNRARLSFDDAGITGRALSYAGSQQGISGADMAQMVKAMTPLMLAQYNVPELQNMVTQAVNTYLDNPGNLVITAEPDAPVPFPMIMGAAMGAPNTLPEVLGVTVEANTGR